MYSIKCETGEEIISPRVAASRTLSRRTVYKDLAEQYILHMSPVLKANIKFSNIYIRSDGIQVRRFLHPKISNSISVAYKKIMAL